MKQLDAALIAQLPTPVTQLCHRLWLADIAPLAVGGAVRDLLLGRLPVQDWDFEVRPRIGMNNFDEVLQQALGPQVQALGFGVYRLKLTEEIHVECSLPRLERYAVSPEDSKLNPLAHTEVEFELDQGLEAKNSFERRDLTINAIGLDYAGGTWQLVDPFGGQEDLQQKIARPCGPQFALDPVRFLRALRFSLIFDLSLSPEMEKALTNVNLSKASDHYLIYEAGKAGFFPFMRHLFGWLARYQTPAPESWLELEFLRDNQLPANFSNSEEWLLLACWSDVWNLSNMGKLERFLKLRRGRAKHYLNGRDHYHFIAAHSWPEQLARWRGLGWPQVKTDADFVRMQECHKHWDSWTVSEEEYLQQLFPMCAEILINWRRLFPRKLNGADAFAHNQQNDGVTPPERSAYRLWCHVQSD